MTQITSIAALRFYGPTLFFIVWIAQGHGFAASYVASATPQVKLPTCDSRSKLMQVVLRSRQYGSELSWLVSKRSASASNDAPSTSNVVMAGGFRAQQQLVYQR